MKIYITLVFLFILSGCGLVETLPAQSDAEKASAKDSVERLYNVVPDVQSCDEGVLKESSKQTALQVVNEIRSLHHLSPVTYNYEDDPLVAKSALISVANNDIEHRPPTTSKCYSEEGAVGSRTSNLDIDYEGSYEDSVSDDSYSIKRFLIDEDVESLGHRRWLLFPFLKEIAYGRVDGKPITTGKYEIVTSVSLKVIDDEVADISKSEIDYVAYPYEAYPSQYFKHGWYCSFSVLVDREERWNNNDVDYSHAKITVTDESGKQYSVSDVSYNTNNYGLSNAIQWKIQNTKNNTKYTVKLENVIVQGESRAYQYWFSIM